MATGPTGMEPFDGTPPGRISLVPALVLCAQLCHCCRGDYHSRELFLESLCSLPFGFFAFDGLLFGPIEAQGSYSSFWAFRFLPSG